MHLAQTLVDLFVKGHNGFNALYLRINQGYGVACVPTSIDEWGESNIGIAAKFKCELLQFG